MEKSWFKCANHVLVRMRLMVEKLHYNQRKIVKNCKVLNKNKTFKNQERIGSDQIN